MPTRLRSRARQVAERCAIIISFAVAVGLAAVIIAAASFIVWSILTRF